MGKVDEFSANVEKVSGFASSSGPVGFGNKMASSASPFLDNPLLTPEIKKLWPDK